MMDGKVNTARPRARSQHTFEIGRGHEAADLSRGRSQVQATSAASCRSLDRQALAALGAACVDDGAATARLHAHEEAVRAGAADFGGLVGAFHGESSSVFLRRSSGPPRLQRPAIFGRTPRSGNRLLEQKPLFRSMTCTTRCGRAGGLTEVRELWITT